MTNKLYIDIETIPCQKKGFKEGIAVSHPAQMKKPETIALWENSEGKYAGEKEKAIEDAYRKTSFSGISGEIISVAWAFNDDPVNCIHRELGAPESILLKGLFKQVSDEIDSLNTKEIIWVGHNLLGFDLKFIQHRCIINGVRPTISIPHNATNWDDRVYDTMTRWAGNAGRISMDKLCEAFGFDGKGDIDGSMVWDYIQAGRYQEIVDYNKDDVHSTRLIYKKMNFIEG